LKAERHSPRPTEEEPSLRVIPGGRHDEEPEPPALALDVGQALKDTRTRRRISLERAASDTRISRKALKGLEGSGPPEDLPDAPYDRYFLKEYARYLGLDPEPLVAEWDAREGREPDPPLSMLLSERPPRRWPVVVLAMACAATLGVLAFFGLTSDRPPPLATSNVAAPEAPPAAEESPSPAQGSGGAAAPTGIRAAFRLTAACWIQATVDGDVKMAETVSEGKTFRLRANRRLDLILGNAGGVRLTVNGKVVTAGDPGQVVRLSYVWKNGRLRAV
jgi:transcriptional regulator with XRE-family HTH domain